LQVKDQPESVYEIHDQEQFETEEKGPEADFCGDHSSQDEDQIIAAQGSQLLTSILEESQDILRTEQSGRLASCNFESTYAQD